MGKLIDGDELIELLLSTAITDKQREYSECVQYAVQKMPTVDAVPVRCKDCLHNCACEIQYHAQAGDLFFCGAAERKDGEQA